MHPKPLIRICSPEDKKNNFQAKINGQYIWICVMFLNNAYVLVITVTILGEQLFVTKVKH